VSSTEDQTGIDPAVPRAITISVLLLLPDLQRGHAQVGQRQRRFRGLGLDLAANELVTDTLKLLPHIQLGSVVVDPAKFDFYSMDCYRHLAEDRLAETLATEVIQASTDFDGTERAPMRLAEARITLGVVAARQGDLEQAIHHGERALGAPRKSLPSPLMVSRDLTRVLNDQYPNEPQTQAYLDHLNALTH